MGESLHSGRCRASEFGAYPRTLAVMGKSPGWALAESGVGGKVGEGGREDPRTPSPTEGHQVLHPHFSNLPSAASFPKACSAGTIDSTRATVPGSGPDPSGPMRWRCHLLLCNLAEPARCWPGWDLLASRTMAAGQEQVWRLSITSTPASVSLCLWVSLSFTILGFTLLFAPGC